MRLPYLQVTTELIEQIAPDLAVEFNLSEAEVGWGLIKLLKYVLGRCPDHEPPSKNDVIPGPTAARLIARGAGYQGDPDEYVRALELVQPKPLVERVPGGIRFRGLKRYDATWRKNRRQGHGRDAPEENPDASRPGPAREPDGNRGDPDRKTQTQTQSEETKALGHERPGTNERTGSPPLSPSRGRRPTGSQQASGGRGFFLWFQGQRRRCAKAFAVDAPRERYVGDLAERGEAWWLKYEHEHGRARLEAVALSFLRNVWSWAKNNDGRPRGARFALLISDGVFADRVIATTTTTPKSIEDAA